MGRPWDLGLGGGVREDLDNGFSVNLASTLTAGDAHCPLLGFRGLPVDPGLTVGTLSGPAPCKRLWGNQSTAYWKRWGAVCGANQASW